MVETSSTATTERWVTAFVKAAPASAHWSQRSGLPVLLKDLWDCAVEAWPGLGVDPERFFTWLAGRLPPDAAVDASLLRLDTKDLYVAFACCERSPQAVAAIEARYAAELQSVLLRRLRLPSDLVAESLQELRRKLFVGDAHSPPRIGEYRGQGPLKSFLAVTAVRIALSQLRHKSPADPNREVDLLEVAAPDDDPELQLLKKRYRDEFRAAFAEAFAALSSRERNILRYHFLDHLNIDEIGLLYRVHRATIARWLMATRQTLFAATRAALMRRLQISEIELESIMRLIQSRYEASIHRLLGGSRGPHDGSST